MTGAPDSGPEYTAHDFSIMDGLVGDLRDQHLESLASQRARTREILARAGRGRSVAFLRRSKGWALVIASLGLLAFFVLAGLSLLDDQKQSSISIMRGEARERVETMQSGNVVVNYVLFRNIPFSEDGFDKITVGMRYDSEGDEEPSYQWCYIERATSVAPVIDHFQLATKSVGHIDTEILSIHAAELGTTVDVLLRAQSNCLFE